MPWQAKTGLAYAGRVAEQPAVGGASGQVAQVFGTHSALAEPPGPDERADVLFELGALETMQDPAAAAGHLSEALGRTTSWPRRGEIALALAEALALGGQFAAAVHLLTSASAEAADERSREGLQAALFNTAPQAKAQVSHAIEYSSGTGADVGFAAAIAGHRVLRVGGRPTSVPPWVRR
jgi:thioredoxin-like negative regulator of GroEL